MKKRFLLARLMFQIVALWVLHPVYSSGQVPHIITYQGRVTSGGTAFDGLGLFKFALVNGGTATASGATASATVVNGFIVGITVTKGGSGYTSPPTVTIADPSGSGARAVALIAGGAVVGLQVQNAGNNYSIAPLITIAAPPTTIDYATYWSHDGTSLAGGPPTSLVKVPVSQGLFTVALGDVNLLNMNALTPAIFDNPDVRLRIWFGDGTKPMEMHLPDQHLTAVGYAMVAANVPDGAVTASKLAPGAITEAKLSPTLRARLDGPPS